MHILKEILIKKETSLFRTSVNSKQGINTLRPLLNELVGNKNWDFNLKDHENILRVHYFPSMNNFLAREIHKMGFECVEIGERNP